MARIATVHWTPLCEARLQSMHPFLLAPPFDNKPHEPEQISCLQFQALTDSFNSLHICCYYLMVPQSGC